MTARARNGKIGSKTHAEGMASSAGPKFRSDRGLVDEQEERHWGWRWVRSVEQGQVEEEEELIQVLKTTVQSPDFILMVEGRHSKVA